MSPALAALAEPGAPGRHLPVELSAEAEAKDPELAALLRKASLFSGCSVSLWVQHIGSCMCCASRYHGLSLVCDVWPLWQYFCGFGKVW